MKKIGIAIIGASHRSSALFDFTKQYGKVAFVTGLYDLIPERASCLIDHYAAKDVVIYKSMHEAIHDPRAEAIFIGTPDSQHVEPAVMALEAGKHVYCEKPMAITLEDCDKIINAAKNANSVFYLGMNLRHGPFHEKIHQIITSGQLGKVLTIEANEYYGGGRSYFRRWNRLRKFGGGLWITKSCHDFDLLNWLAGAKPKSVYASSNLSFYTKKPEGGMSCRECPIKGTCSDYYDIMKPELPLQNKLLEITEKTTGLPRDLCLFNSEKDTFDNGMALVEYENDIRATYTVSVVSGRNTRELRVQGTLGSLEGDIEEGIIKIWPRYSQEVLTVDVRDMMNSSHEGADDRIFMDFFNCCCTLSKPRSSWADGRLSLELALAATRSCDEGQLIKVN
jgi:predicted dehydrogenase